MKKILAAALAIIAVLIMPFNVSAEEGSFNGDSFTAFSNLSAAWAEAGYAMYPEYVGGVYFADNGNLVIALCNDSQSVRNEISALSGAPDVIEFITVKYSYDELYAVQEEIMYNCDNEKYDFLVNFASIAEDKNVIEVSVGNSDVETAESYFSAMYGDKVYVYGGYETVDDIDYDSDTEISTQAERIEATKSLRTYINIGVVSVALIAVIVTTYASKGKNSTAKRRYRK